MGVNWSGLATPDPDKTDALSLAALLADFVVQELGQGPGCAGTVDWGTTEQMANGEDASLGRKKQPWLSRELAESVGEGVQATALALCGVVGDDLVFFIFGRDSLERSRLEEVRYL